MLFALPAATRRRIDIALLGARFAFIG